MLPTHGKYPNFLELYHEILVTNCPISNGPHPLTPTRRTYRLCAIDSTNIPILDEQRSGVASQWGYRPNVTISLPLVAVSIMTKHGKTQFLTAQKKGKVNGMEVEGPLHIVQKMTLKEISFVEYGADLNTSASVETIAISGENTREHFLDGGLDLQQQNQSEVSMENQNRMNTETATRVEPKAETSVNTAFSGVVAEAKVKPAAAMSIGLEQAEAEVLAYRKKLIQERERINRIEQLAKGRFHDLKMKAIAEGWEPDQFELETLRTDRETPTEVIRKSVQWESDNQVLEVIALTASGLAHSAFADKYDPMVLKKADKWRGMGLQEFCERASGVQLPRFKRDAHGWLQAAFSTTTLPGILASVANKMLLEGYNYVADLGGREIRYANENDTR